MWHFLYLMFSLIDSIDCEEAQINHVTSDGVYKTDTTGLSRPDPQIQNPIASLEISETVCFFFDCIYFEQILIPI